MLQDPKTIRYYQRLSDTLSELWRRGYRSQELQLFRDGFITALRYGQELDSGQIYRLEQEITRFQSSPENFESPDFMPMLEEER
ncbi:MAG: hypothetical protein H7Y22_01830 [Gemmatimonadaceae bacterium]|nr:hypothetical protein [Gloeobacterales cyanobacterium ES-bin-141]